MDTWDSQFYSPAADDDMTPMGYGNPYAALRNTKRQASGPESGMRYEQNGIPASTDPPGCPCGNCPWRATVERGAALIAMPKQSLDARTDAAMAANFASVLRNTLTEYGVGKAEGMTAGSSTVSIIPEKLDTRMFILIFVFVLIIYVLLTTMSSIAELRQQVRDLGGR